MESSKPVRSIGLRRLCVVVVVNVAVLVMCVGSLEIAARLWAPEFTGDIHSPRLTRGRSYHRSEFAGQMIRVPAPGVTPEPRGAFFVVLGDSISNGYGMAYEDIYWVQLERLFRAASGEDVPRMVALSGNGSTLADALKALRALADVDSIDVREVLYQFNFNDITPVDAARLHEDPEATGVSRAGRAFARWRYQWLNHSTFLRLVQHHVGRLRWKRRGSCEERGLEALGPYSWTFASRPVRTQAEALWRKFESDLRETASLAHALHARFRLWLSPLLYDVDVDGLHPYYNPRAFDFSCATVDPRRRLSDMADALGIEIIDPAPALRASFERRVREGNMEPYFFTADDNHFTPPAARIVAEVLFKAYGTGARETWGGNKMEHSAE